MHQTEVNAMEAYLSHLLVLGGEQSPLKMFGYILELKQIWRPNIHFFHQKQQQQSEIQFKMDQSWQCPQMTDKENENPSWRECTIKPSLKESTQITVQQMQAHSLKSQTTKGNSTMSKSQWIYKHLRDYWIQTRIVYKCLMCLNTRVYLKHE